MPHHALARETIIAQDELVALLRATVRDLQRRAKRGGKAAIRAAYEAGGVGLRAVAAQFGVGVETVRRCLG